MSSAVDGPDTGEVASFTAYSPEAVGELLKALKRLDTNHIFEQDVLITHPHLAEQYTTVCPTRCDLSTALRKAVKGEYSNDANLSALRSDIQLMVSNCFRFNGRDSPISGSASQFLAAATQAIETFIRYNGSLYPSPSSGDLVAVVNKLNRKEDSGAFAVDVTVAYPELKEKYLQVCPHVMHLTLMRQKAEGGEYTKPTGSTPVWGSTIAESLLAMREDVETIVSNCLTFNAAMEEWLKRARCFQRHAHMVIDQFVLKCVPSLKGTLTGVKKYGLTPPSATSPSASSTAISSTPAPAGGMARRRGRERAGEEGSSSGSAAEEVAAMPPRKALKFVDLPAQSTKPGSATMKFSSSAIPAPRVEVVKTVPVTPKLAATQPSLHIPPRMRARLVSDHLSRLTLGARLVGRTYLVRDLVGSIPSATHIAGGEVQEGEEEVSDAAVPEKKIELTAGHSAHHLLASFEDHLVSHYTAQRLKPVVENAFHYSAEEQQVALDVVKAIRAQFNSLLLSALVYEKESVELRAHLSEEGVGRFLSGLDEESGEGGDWLPRVHYAYLCRLAVQFPQIASLCCCSVAEKKADGTPTRLVFSLSMEAVVSHVTRVVGELLAFVEQYEERLLRSLAAPVSATSEAGAEPAEGVSVEESTSAE